MTEQTLAREFPRSAISKVFPTMGTVLPPGDRYQRLIDTGFRTWKLRVGGLVMRPLELSLSQLQDYPSRSQITQHQCDQGWTAIAEWTGVSLGRVLQAAGVVPQARYVVLHCMDPGDEHGTPLYESLDLFDAFHPQTLLAYGMNGRPLAVPHGAPLRLRAEFHIGYKNVKYVDRIEVVASLEKLGRGNGSSAADTGQPWYAGV